MGGGDLVRCAWCGDDPDYMAYHDHEWGVPLYDDRLLFEFLILEGAQAGLSWLTILKRRENYRRAYEGFNPAVVAAFDEAKQAGLLGDAGIIRNRLKVAASISNAQAYIKVQEEFGSFSDYLWGFVDGNPIKNAWRTLGEIPAETGQSKTLSKDLKKRGFKFVGPTICYALMQAVGMVNDHLVDCFRYNQV
jgi:DNA-3-methyladenine glycosylase I